VAEWDFAAGVGELLHQTERGAGPRSMSQMIEAAETVVRAGRSDPAQLQRWLNDNAEVLVGQQILVSSVHAQLSAGTELPRVLRAWAAGVDLPTAAAAMDWLKEEYPALLRAWLLSRVEELLDAELRVS
jgi:hypothetical protein